MKLNWLLISSLVLSSQSLFAGKAHVHGIAELAVAKDGNNMTVEFKASAHDIFGFESKPKNKKQKSIVSNQMSELDKVNELIELPKESRCTVLVGKIVNPFAGNSSKDDHKHKSKHDDDHKHKSKHDDDHKHKSKHDDDHKSKHADGHKHKSKHDDDHKHKSKHADNHKHESGHDDEHKDVMASYKITCSEKTEKMELLTSFKKKFPKIKEIKFLILTDKNQNSFKSKKPQVKLSL